MKSKKGGFLTVLIVFVVSLVEAAAALFVAPFRGHGVKNIDRYVEDLREFWWIFLLVAFALTTTVNTIYCVRYIKKRRIKSGLVPYDEFVKFYMESPQRCDLKYEGFIIVLEGTRYRVVKDGRVLSERAFTTLQELFDAQIISSRTLKELWNELQ